MRKTKGRPGVLVTLSLLVVVGVPASAQAESAGWQVGSAVSTLVYAPVKVMYAAAGVVFGGISWGMSGGNSDVAQAVIAPAVHGDYLVTPEHLRGERRLVFVGSDVPGGAPEPELAAEPVWGDDDAALFDYESGY